MGCRLWKGAILNVSVFKTSWWGIVIIFKRKKTNWCNVEIIEDIYDLES